MAEVIVILAVAVIIISLFIHMKKCGSKKAAITITGNFLCLSYCIYSSHSARLNKTVVTVWYI